MSLEKAYLTMTSGTHNKHYFVAVLAHPVVPGDFLLCTAWGRIGGTLQMPTNHAQYRSYIMARAAYFSLVREKISKGYESLLVTPGVLAMAPSWFFTTDAEVHSLLGDDEVIKPKSGAKLHPDWAPHPRDHRRLPAAEVPKQTTLQKAMQDRAKKARWGF